ncbi:MAG TPA: hypothetical protein VF273_00610 [Pelobium sp.]
MKVLFDIEDNRVPFVMELLNNLKFVKTKTLTAEKAELICDIREAVNEVNLIRSGKLEGVSAKELLDEL